MRCQDGSGLQAHRPLPAGKASMLDWDCSGHFGRCRPMRVKESSTKRDACFDEAWRATSALAATGVFRRPEHAAKADAEHRRCDATGVLTSPDSCQD